eukprot:gene15686-17268_t
MAEHHQKNSEFLEHQYSPSRWSKLIGPSEIINDHCTKSLKASSHARNATNVELDIKYGDLDGQKMDIFYPKVRNEAEKVLVFLHGGYWQELGKEYYSYIGGIFSAFGIIVAVIGYDLAPKVKMNTIYGEVKESIVYLAKRFPHSRIFVSGHSAGGHLASLLLKEDWSEFHLRKNLLDGVMVVSGVFDLQPLVQTYVNDALKMDTEEAKMFSPMSYIQEVKLHSNCNVLCLIGEYESDEFHRQSRDYCKALHESGINADMRVIKDTDHFSIMHDFLKPDYEVIGLFLNFMTSRGK